MEENQSFPLFPDKYNHESITNPSDYAAVSKYPRHGPLKIIITYEPSCLDYFIEKYQPAEDDKVVLNPDLVVYKHNDIGFVRIPGVGGANAVTFVEELIALGAKYFISVGTAGGLHREGVYVCQKAFRDEGTSYHYLPPRNDLIASIGGLPEIFPKSHLRVALEKSLKEKDLSYQLAPTWTTDAPYRETRPEVDMFSKNHGVATVEMECASLFALAEFRQVAIASVLIVGDVLNEKWEHTPRPVVDQRLNALVDAAIDCLENYVEGK